MRRYTLVLTVFLILSCPAEEPGFDGITLDFRSAVPQGEEAVIDVDFAGMCHTGYSNQLEREYGIINEMGIVWLHRDFSWSSIQPSEDTWNFTAFDGYVARANQEGKKIMGMLLYDVGWVHDKYGHPRERRIREEQIPYFVDYAVETVQRYNGKNGYGFVDAWLIWNEPDLYPRFWTGTQEEFFALNKAVAGAIRKLDETEGTHTFLIGGVFTSLVSDTWITGLFEQGGMIEHDVDGIAFHPYGPNPLSCAAVFQSFMQKVAPYGYADKIWLNEMGYPTYLEKGPIPQGRYGTDQYEGTMPEVAAKTFTLMAAGGAKNLTWYHLFDSRGLDASGQDTRRNNNSEDWFGLVWRKNNEEWPKKGGYWGYALCANNIPGKTYKKLDWGSSVPANVHNYYFEGNDGSRVLVVWSNDPLVPVDIRVSFGGSNHRLWSVVTGESVPIGETSTHTLHHLYSDNHNLLFFTWDN